MAVGMGLTLASFSMAPAFAQTLSEKIVAMEKAREQEFAAYFGESLAEVTQTPEDIALTLQKITAETGKKTSSVVDYSGKRIFTFSTSHP